MKATNPFAALVYRLEQHIARTENTLISLKLQLEAAKALASGQEPLPLAETKKTK